MVWCSLAGVSRVLVCAVNKCQVTSGEQLRAVMRVARSSSSFSLTLLATGSNEQRPFRTTPSEIDHEGFPPAQSLRQS